MIQNLAQNHSDKIAAGTWCGGRLYSEWRSKCEIPLMVLSTWGCPGKTNTDKTVKKQRLLGGNLLQNYTPLLKPEDFHSAGYEAIDLMQIFIHDTINIYGLHKGKKLTVNDFYNELSIEFKDKWDYLPKNIDQFFPECGYCNINFYTCHNKNKNSLLVFLADTDDEEKMASLQNVLWHNALKHCNLIMLQKRHPALEETHIFLSFVNMIMFSDFYSSYSIYVGGNRIAGCIAAAVSLKTSKRIQGCITYDTPLDYPFEDLSINGIIKDENIPFIHLKSDDDFKMLGSFMPSNN